MRWGGNQMGDRGSRTKAVRLVLALVAISQLVDGQPTPVQEKFVGSTISWEIGHNFLTATEEEHRIINVTLTTAWLVRDQATTYDDEQGGICFQSGQSHLSATCGTGFLKYWQCRDDRCGSDSRSGEETVGNDLTVVNDFVMPAETDVSAMTLATGKFHYPIKVQTDTQSVLVSFTLVETPDTDDSNPDDYWANQLSLEWKNTEGFGGDRDFYCSSTTNCNHRIQTFFSDGDNRQFQTMINPTWIRTCTVGSSSNGCQEQGSRKRVQNYHSPRVDFPLMLFTNAATANTRLGTHIKASDYDGQYLRVLQRYCSLDNLGSAKCTSDEVTSALPVVDIQDVAPGISTFHIPSGADAIKLQQCADKGTVPVYDEDEGNGNVGFNCMSAIKQVIEVQDYTWRELEVRVSAEPDHYEASYDPYIDITTWPSIYWEGTAVSAVVSTWYTGAEFAADGASADRCSSTKVPTISLVGVDSSNELECVYSNAADSCKFQVRATVTDQPVTLGTGAWALDIEVAAGFEEDLLSGARGRTATQLDTGFGLEWEINPIQDWRFLPGHAITNQTVGEVRTICMFAANTANTNPSSLLGGGKALCLSEVLCVRIKLKNNPPSFDPTVTPMELNSRDERGIVVPQRTDVPACLGYPLDLTLRATDKDVGDLVRIYVEEVDPGVLIPDGSTSSILGRNAFLGPFCGNTGTACQENGIVTYEEYGAERVGDTTIQTSARTLEEAEFDSSIFSNYADHITFTNSTVVQQSIEYNFTVDQRNGIFVQQSCFGGEQDCRQRQLNYDPVICGAAYDNSRDRWRKWQGAAASDNLDVHGFGDASSSRHCWRVRLQAPPVFTTNISGCANSRASVTFECTPFPDQRAPQILSTTANSQAYRQILMPVGVHLQAVLTAEDPNPEDKVEILLLENPGIPPGMTVGRSLCEPRDPMTRRYCGTKVPDGSTICSFIQYNDDVDSSCSKASRTLEWTPGTGDAGTNFLVCFVARDDSTMCNGQGPADATSAGWYGEQHCMNLTVVRPDFEWTTGFVDEYVSAPEPHEAFVGCTFSLPVEIVETSFAGSGLDTAYGLEVSRANQLSAVEQAGRVQIVNDRSHEAGSIMEITPHLGSEGHTLNLCFQGGDTQQMVASTGYCERETGPWGYKRCDADTPCKVGACVPVCVQVKVQKCRYCVRDGDALSNLIVDFMLDTNWLKVWTLNADNVTKLGTQCTKELDCAISQDLAIDNPELMLKTDATDGGRGKRILWAGLLYKTYTQESMTNLACRFKTTMKSLSHANPELDVSPGGMVMPGTDVCMISCNNRRDLASDLTTINC